MVYLGFFWSNFPKLNCAHCFDRSFIHAMGKGEGQGEASGHARGRGHKSRWTTNDICWVLVPTLVLGVPVLIAGIVIYFYWENK